MSFSGLGVFRWIVFSVAIALGIVEIALEANFLSIENRFEHIFGVPFPPNIYNELGIAVGALTTLTVSAMLLLDTLFAGPLTSMIVVELVWLFVLAILWFAEGGLMVQTISPLIWTGSCDPGVNSSLDSDLVQVCNDIRALEIIAFVAASVLQLYTITLLIVAIVCHSRGAPIWTSSVTQQRQASAALRSATWFPYALSDGTSGNQPLVAMGHVDTSHGRTQREGFTEPQQQGYFVYNTPMTAAHPTTPAQSHSIHPGLGSGPAGEDVLSANNGQAPAFRAGPPTEPSEVSTAPPAYSTLSLSDASASRPVNEARAMNQKRAA